MSSCCFFTDSATQKDKKRDCKRLNDNTNDTNDAIPKKRERRCEESSNDCMDGKANNASPHEVVRLLWKFLQKKFLIGSKNGKRVKK